MDRRERSIAVAARLPSRSERGGMGPKEGAHTPAGRATFLSKPPSLAGASWFLMPQVEPATIENQV